MWPLSNGKLAKSERLTARDVAWQARRLNPHEIRQMGLPLSTKQRWLQTNPQQASMLDIRTLVSFGATRSLLLLRLEHGWLEERTRFNGSCVQINFDVDRMCGQSAELYAGVQAAAASLESSGDLDAGRAVATLVLCEEGVHIWTPSAQTSERFMKVMICGEHVGTFCGLRVAREVPQRARGVLLRVERRLAD